MLCSECLKDPNFHNSKCDQCQSKNVLRKINNKYYFQGQVYSKSKWYRKMANYLSFANNDVNMRRYPDEIRIDYIKTFVLKNIKKMTFLMLVLPCILLLLLSCVILWLTQFYKNRGIFEYEHVVLFAKFISISFSVLGSILLFKIIFYQEKIIMIGSDKRVRMRHISKKQYEKIKLLFLKK